MARRWLPGLVLLAVAGCAGAVEKVGRNIILPEQRTVEHRDPAEFPPAALPPSVPPRTVSHPRPETPEWRLSLDEAIRIALENAQVVRVLAGVTATSSGLTIYDPAINNTTIDQEQGRFDPIFSHRSTFSQTDTPAADITGARTTIGGLQTEDYRSETGIEKTNVLGGLWALTSTDNPSHFDATGLPLNPEQRHALELSYTQPLLQGGGFRVNTAPIVIARLNTERSYFQYKDSVQELVRGVIEAYWNLVRARIDVWARKIQVQQSEEAYQREQARMKTGFADLGSVSQARVTYNQFRANLVAAEADVLTREAVLRNILGLPPNDDRQIVPVSVPTTQRLEPGWEPLVGLAQERRPDIVEFKIILEADQVRLLQAENQALPRLDSSALYRWNGLSGSMPGGEGLSSSPGQFTDWSLGINFSVPLGRRQGRAQVRQQSFLVSRDQADLYQGLHAAIHELASTTRELASNYEQYLAFKETRSAAFDNLTVQIEQFRARRNIYLNVLQALNDWGNAVTSEARALLTYNVALANLERQTGTILETHGLVFFEERLRSAGPLGIVGSGRFYPSALPPIGSPERYPATSAPAENSFDLRNPNPREMKPDELPKPRPVKPEMP